MIALRNLRFRYGATEPAVFENLDFELSAPMTAILGVSGCGKTTLLRLIAGLLQPEEGKVEVARDSVQLVFQDPRLLPWMTVRQNIEFALRAARVPPAEWPLRVDPLLDHVGLAHVRSYRPDALSIGMAQRISLVRSLALRPSVLLLDEPFAAVDPLQREALQLGLQELLRDAPGTTAVIVTHDIGEALVLGDRVIVLAGRPSAPRLDLAVTAPRPRATEFRLSREFAGLQREVRAALGLRDGLE